MCIHAHMGGSAGSVIDKESCPSAWAEVLTADLRDGFSSLLGIFGSVAVLESVASRVMCESSACLDLIGATCHLSDTDEWSAVVWALVWKLQLRRPCPFVLQGNATVLLYATSGHQRWLAEPVMRFARSVAMLPQQHCQFSCLHVKDHSGDPHNELADFVCGCISTSKMIAISPPPSVPVEILSDSDTLQWMWLATERSFCVAHQ